MSDRVLRRASVTLSGAGTGIAGYLTDVHDARRLGRAFSTAASQTWA